MEHTSNFSHIEINPKKNKTHDKRCFSKGNYFYRRSTSMAKLARKYKEYQYIFFPSTHKTAVNTSLHNFVGHNISFPAMDCSSHWHSHTILWVSENVWRYISTTAVAHGLFSCPKICVCSDSVFYLNNL